MENLYDLLSLRRQSIPIRLSLDEFDHLVEAIAGRSDPHCIILGSRKSRFIVVALSFSELNFHHVMKWSIDLPNQIPAKRDCVATGLVGLISYDDFSSHSPTRSPSRVFYVGRSLVYDMKRSEARIEWDDGCEELDIQIDWEQLLRSAKPSGWSEEGGCPLDLNWSPMGADQHYKDLFYRCQEDIKKGRYYQANLLRYFECNYDRLPASYWWRRLQKLAGPCAAWFRFADWELVSFSPERFVHWQPMQTSTNEQPYLSLRTQPIKGTVAAFSDPILDEKAIRTLLNSTKDHAELHMIVDLMRNDLFRVCLPGSVKVENSGSLRSFSTVHHLVATISGLIEMPSSLGKVLTALCPAGSITGAPKIEVMQAIFDYEGRSRDYFMGHVFTWDPRSQYFDSSILIRTVQKRFDHDRYEFAAGSGLVIASDLVSEMDEILAKSRVIFAP